MTSVKFKILSCYGFLNLKSIADVCGTSETYVRVILANSDLKIPEIIDYNDTFYNDN